MSRERNNKRKREIHAKVLHTLMVSYVFNSHGKNKDQKKHIYNELNGEWLAYCKKKNKSSDPTLDRLNTQGFVNMIKDKKTLEKVREMLQLPKEKSLLQKIFTA